MKRQISPDIRVAIAEFPATVDLAAQSREYGAAVLMGAPNLVRGGSHLGLMSRPSPIPRFDNPKMQMSPALQLFGAGREKRMYAIPPYTKVKSLDFEDHPFTVEKWDKACELCGSTESYLDEVVIDDQGGQMWICSDTDYCNNSKFKTDETSFTGSPTE